MKNIITYILIAIIFCACTKQDEWLSEKSQKNIVVPKTLVDYQAILDNQAWIHNIFSNDCLVSADDFYLNDTGFNSEDENTRNFYSWNDNIWVNGRSHVWNDFFSIIFKSNAVIDGLNDKDKNLIANIDHYNNVLGQAYFYRAIIYYNLAQIFCKTYDSRQASSTLGLPLRKSSDVNIIYQRSNLKDTYQFILEDIERAINLLPTQGKHNRRPSKVVAFGLLAKIYLVMENYDNAFKYAHESLKANSTLLDFNSSYIDMNSTYRFQSDGYNHPEILFFAKSQRKSMVLPYNRTNGFVANELYAQYDINDLRRSAFFIASGNNYKYRGSYTGSLASFCGIANNEIYIILAESAARIGEEFIALDALNRLLTNRYTTNTFIPYSECKGEDLLKLILQERRKELVGVGNLRWEDIKRLNKDSRFQVILIRMINSKEHVLLPTDNRYVFPIPEEEIQSSGLQQTPR
ncbi:RagB/SusD family nutrient uptake outer membrane protein [Pedobacter nyackensis]|uniref:SusD family protein n=1 Tax=Pedobacter nyackensis TaxID=475255 RepID=A0A1W2DW20_9SPHI|nr:RagB/SusD family nutrient uptake outer membrane protein [Pedobacter nyackensis]SMD01272.1 SusD family protein [Pedobacter nyackensis]